MSIEMNDAWRTMDRQIPFSPPDIGEDEIAEVVDTLRSGWITTGPKTKRLEKELAAYFGANRCVCLNSQTACAEMTLRLLQIGPGDEVITSAYTYTASASVATHVGAKLVLVDCQKNSLEMDYDALENAINERTKAIIPVDLGGIPCDYDRIFDIVERKRSLFRPANDWQKCIGRVAVVDDAAHAVGARVKFRGEWKMVGAIADFTNFSFHAVKNFTTAEGGAMTWHLPGADDERVYRQLQLYSLHGQSKDALAKTKIGAWEYDVIGPWFKCNMTDIMASLGLAQLRRYPAMLARRRELVELYDSVLRPLGLETLKHYTENALSSGHLYITRIPGITLEQRQEIIEKLAEKGIAANVHYKPLPLLTAYKNLDFDIARYPNAYAHYANEITLPLHTRLTDDDARYVAGHYAQIVSQYLK